MNARDRHFLQAKQFEAQNEPRQALNSYKQSLECDANFFEAWLNAGVIFSKQEKSEKAIHCFDKALRCKKDEKAYYNLAAEFYKKEDYENAVLNLNRSIATNSEFVRPYLLAGYSLLRLNRPKESVLYFKKALIIEPSNISVYIGIILVLHENSQRGEAKKYLNKALTLNEEHPVLIRMKGIIHLEDGNLSESILEYKKLAVQDPDMKHLHDIFSQRVDGKTRKKINDKTLQLTEKENKTPKDFFDLSLLSMIQGEGEAAMDYLHRVAES